MVSCSVQGSLVSGRSLRGHVLSVRNEGCEEKMDTLFVRSYAGARDTFVVSLLLVATNKQLQTFADLKCFLAS